MSSVLNSKLSVTVASLSTDFVETLKQYNTISFLLTEQCYEYVWVSITVTCNEFCRQRDSSSAFSAYFKPYHQHNQALHSALLISVLISEIKFQFAKTSSRNLSYSVKTVVNCEHQSDPPTSPSSPS